MLNVSQNIVMVASCSKTGPPLSKNVNRTIQAQAGGSATLAGSVEKRGVCYVEYLGDGDSNNFKSVLVLKPYGEDVEISKTECTGHTEKRMGTCLRRLRAQKVMKLISTDCLVY